MILAMIFGWFLGLAIVFWTVVLVKAIAKEVGNWDE